MNKTMNRRRFIGKSGIAFSAAALGIASRKAAADVTSKSARLSDVFPRYTEFSPQVPVYCVTPNSTGCFHRFFNTSPISPSGRFLALTRLLHEDRLSLPGEEAEIVLVDLHTGKNRVLAKTKGFDSQLGAQAQWGATDNELFFNDLDTKQWNAFGVRMDPLTGERHNLAGPVFEVSRDGRYAASICLARSAITQRGYGVVVPTEVLPWNEGAAGDDGVYLTDIANNNCRLIASFKDIAEACGEKVKPTEPDRGGGYHGHQISWNPQGTRLMLCMTFIYPQTKSCGKRRLELNLITLKPNGSDIQVALPSSIWSRVKGHHPCWCPDGDNISMNLMLNGRELSLVNIPYHGRDVSPAGLRPIAGVAADVRMSYDGRGMTVLSDTIIGGGHPSFYPDRRHIVTDAYVGEKCAFGDGTVPIRWIDLAEGTESMLARIQSLPPYIGPFKAMRVDPHPAWDRNYTRIALNACPAGTRQVFIADVANLV